MAQLPTPTQDREQQQDREHKQGREQGRGKSNDEIKGSRKGGLCGRRRELRLDFMNSVNFVSEAKYRARPTTVRFPSLPLYKLFEAGPSNKTAGICEILHFVMFFYITVITTLNKVLKQ